MLSANIVRRTHGFISSLFTVCLLLGVQQGAAEEVCDPPPARFEPILIDCKKPGLVALTFDDGPHRNSPQILDILASQGVKASFFVVGSRLEKAEYAQYLKDMIEQGHVVGNHSWSHPDLTTLSQQKVLEEISKTDDIVWNIAQYRMSFMRPPHGRATAKSAIPAWDRDQTITLWNLDSLDYKPVSEWTAQQELEGIVTRFENSSPAKDSHVILLHEFSPQTLEILPDIISSAKANGFRLVTVEECLQKP